MNKMRKFLSNIFACGNSNKNNSDRDSNVQKIQQKSVNKNKKDNQNNANKNVNQQSKIIPTKSETRNAKGNKNNHKDDRIIRQNNQSNKTERTIIHNNYKISDKKTKNPQIDELININIDELGKQKIKRKPHRNINQSKIEPQIHSRNNFSSSSEQQCEENLKYSQDKSIKINRNIENTNKYKQDMNETISNRKYNNNENNFRIQSGNSDKFNEENNLSRKKINSLYEKSFLDSSKISGNNFTKINGERNHFINNNKSYKRRAEISEIISPIENERFENSCDNSDFNKSYSMKNSRSINESYIDSPIISRNNSQINCNNSDTNGENEKWLTEKVNLNADQAIFADQNCTKQTDEITNRDSFSSTSNDHSKHDEEYQQKDLHSESTSNYEDQSHLKIDEHKDPIVENLNELSETELKRLSILSMDISIGEKTGFENPMGYCFLNSVIQVLRGCKRFNRAILKYHQIGKIEETQENVEEKIIFVIHFCTLLYKLKKKKNVDEQLKGIQSYFISSSTGDDVNKCFMNLLSIINDVTKIKKPPINVDKEADNNFRASRQKNSQFIFDCFYGQFLIKMTCEVCQKIINSKFQLFKCLALPVPEGDEEVPLKKCIKMFFKKSIVEIEDPMKCDCPNGTTKISSKCQITHCPQYLFIYLDRGSLILEGVKKNTFINCSENISIEIVNGNVQYRLISVIDHLGTNENGHYFCKCNYEEDTWWLLNDSQATPMGNCDIQYIITRNTIAFMFKKIIKENNF